MNRIPTEGLKRCTAVQMLGQGPRLNEQNPDRGIETFDGDDAIVVDPWLE